jgi:hypothetical protein
MSGIRSFLERIGVAAPNASRGVRRDVAGGNSPAILRERRTFVLCRSVSSCGVGYVRAMTSPGGCPAESIENEPKGGCV